MSQQQTLPIHIGSGTSPDVAAATDASSRAIPVSTSPRLSAPGLGVPPRRSRGRPWPNRLPTADARSPASSARSGSCPTSSANSASRTACQPCSADCSRLTRSASARPHQPSGHSLAVSEQQAVPGQAGGRSRRAEGVPEFTVMAVRRLPRPNAGLTLVQPPCRLSHAPRTRADPRSRPLQPETRTERPPTIRRPAPPVPTPARSQRQYGHHARPNAAPVPTQLRRRRRRPGL